VYQNTTNYLSIGNTRIKALPAMAMAFNPRIWPGGVNTGHILAILA
jgi:hypothetical protein